MSLFDADELDAIQMDSLEEEMARSLDYQVVTSYDALIDIYTQERRLDTTLNAPARDLCPERSNQHLAQDTGVVHVRTALFAFEEIVKNFGDFTALHGIDLEYRRGRVPHHRRPVRQRQIHPDPPAGRHGRVTARGHSGCAIKRIDQTPANQRPTCMVFQSLALFPHMIGGAEHRVSAQDSQG